MKKRPDGALFRLSKNLPGYKYRREGYHRLARANTPDSVSFRRFLPFSSWLAPASLRLKSQKSLENTSLAGAKQFCRSRNVSRQGKTRREYCRIVKGLDAVWAHFCPSKPCLPLSIDGSIPTIPDFAGKSDREKQRTISLCSPAFCRFCRGVKPLLLLG